MVLPPFNQSSIIANALMKEKRTEAFSQDVCYPEKLIIQNSLNAPDMWTFLSYIHIN